MGPEGPVGPEDSRGHKNPQGQEGTSGGDGFFTQNAGPVSLGNSLSTVDSLALPAGSYVVGASVSVSTLLVTTQATCQLSNGTTTVVARFSLPARKLDCAGGLECWLYAGICGNNNAVVQYRARGRANRLGCLDHGG